MKRFPLIVLTLLTVFTISCKKDKNVRKNSDYYLSAMKNNVAWNSPSVDEQSSASGSQQLSFAGTPFYNSYYTTSANNEIIIIASVGEEHLYINMLSNGPNSYQFDKAKTKFYITVGQDAMGADYALDDSKTNTANITNMNVAKKTISGNFILNFKKVYGHESYPATVAFTNGKFYLTTFGTN